MSEKVCPTCGNSGWLSARSDESGRFVCNICDEIAAHEGRQRYLEVAATGTQAYHDLQAEVERLREMLAQCRPYVEGLSGVVDETAELLAAIDAVQRKEK